MDKLTVLAKYLPAEAAPVVARWIDYFKCEFTISKSRNSKFGDYRPPFKGRGHRISVNYNLNPYAFLVTTVHEFAHLLTWQEHQRKAKPHGAEWKSNFKRMMKPFLDKKVFPEDVCLAVTKYLDNPAASSCTDVNLFRVLRQYDPIQTSFHTVESLPENAVFALKDQRIFRKESRLRKRFRCTELKTGLVYLFSPLAEVYPLKDHH